MAENQDSPLAHNAVSTRANVCFINIQRSSLSSPKLLLIANTALMLRSTPQRASTELRRCCVFRKATIRSYAEQIKPSKLATYPATLATRACDCVHSLELRLPYSSNREKLEYAVIQYKYHMSRKEIKPAAFSEEKEPFKTNGDIILQHIDVASIIHSVAEFPL